MRPSGTSTMPAPTRSSQACRVMSSPSSRMRPPCAGTRPASGFISVVLLFTLYEPWLQERLDRFEASILRIKDPRKRLERILMALWRDLPRDSNGFANNVMQAVSTSAGSSDYSPRLRELFQARVAGWIASCMRISMHEAAGIAAVVLMAFDGFAMNVHLAHGVACDRSIASRFGALLVDPGRVDPGRMP